MVEDLQHVKEDYEKIRDEMYEILVDAKDALKLAKNILEESEHPRAVETYSGLLKNVNSIQTQILELTKTYKDIISKNSKSDVPVLPQGESTTNVFLGTTTELQEKLLEAGIFASNTIDVTPKTNDE